VRNRHLARNSSQKKNSGLRFDIGYQILPDSVQRIPGGICCQLSSVFEATPFLQAELTMLTSGTLHTYITEINPLYPRYRAPHNDILNPDAMHTITDESVKIADSNVVIEFDKYKYEISYSPLTIEGFYDGNSTIKINKNSLMNFDRYRPRNTDLKPENQEKSVNQPIQILDSAGAYIEKDGELTYFDGLWTETFRDFVDNKKRGPSSVAMDFSFVDATDVYGLPEHADNLSLKDTYADEPYRIYNIDHTEHGVNVKNSLYGNIPFMLSRANKKQSAGVFWLNPSETYVDIDTLSDSKFTHWISESGVIEFFTFLGENPLNIVSKYTLLTGPPQLPPLFALGYHQCRWNYMSQEDLLDVASGFVKHDLPMDVIWLDIEYTPERQYFLWNHETFPNPLEMQDSLTNDGRKLVTIIDPHIKRSETYSVHRDAVEKDLYVKNENGTDYEGLCWPGHSSWLDFSRKEVQDYWAAHYTYEKFPGSTSNTFIWNDMNEPSVFQGPEGTMPKGNLHGDYEHRDLHNLYGMLMMKSTYNGLLQRSNNVDRPFVLTRSFFAGTQKYGAIWTGDNTARWEYLEYSVPMCLSVALGGVSMCGADVGGFFGNPEPELLVRWYQLAAFMPFYRGHSSIESNRREPWLFGEPYTTKIREAIRMRYALLPYIYTLFSEYQKTGEPVIRPLFLQFPTDSKAAKIDQQFLLGSAIMVAAITQAAQEKVNVYLPEGKWYDYHTFAQVESGEFHYEAQENWVPSFIKGGNIISRQDRVRNNSGLKMEDPYTFIVALDEKQEAVGSLYVDDTKTHNYQQGEFLKAELKLKEQKLKYEVKNNMALGNKIESVVVVGIDKTPERVLIENANGVSEAEFVRKDNTLIVKLTQVQINEDWELTIN
jgi:alpha 1,3-glucosidase